ncbi:MAG: phosphate ABC transporter permease PstA [Kiritimatiellia bacterium]
MDLYTRRVLDRSFTGLGVFSLVLMGCALAVLIIPILTKGISAFVFKETVERKEFFLEEYGRGNRAAVEKELALAEQAREPVYRMMAEYERPFWSFLEEAVEAGKSNAELERKIVRREHCVERLVSMYNTEVGWSAPALKTRLDKLKARHNIKDYCEIKKLVRDLLGPLPDDNVEADLPLLRQKYGQRRWNLAQEHLDSLLYRTEYVFEKPGAMGTPVKVPRSRDFQGTAIEPMFDYCKANAGEMLLPRRTFYWRFLFDEQRDSYMFGGIWGSFLGTIYLTLGAMLFAAPVGVISAIYLTQYASQGRFISLLRSCISTLAGVPSVVFGLFGLAFFINTLKVSEGKSVLVGCLVLAMLVLPTVIRASEEAILAVPKAYREASLGLGATKWHTIVKVVLPASLPGIITSIIISMGRAAGETAPILFTAAVAVGEPILPWEIVTRASPAMPANIYSIVSEHEAVEEIAHVQYGMVLALVGLVLLLNVTAIILRARISRRLR